MRPGCTFNKQGMPTTVPPTVQAYLPGQQDQSIVLGRTFLDSATLLWGSYSFLVPVPSAHVWTQEWRWIQFPLNNWPWQVSSALSNSKLGAVIPAIVQVASESPGEESANSSSTSKSGCLRLDTTSSTYKRIHSSQLLKIFILNYSSAHNVSIHITRIFGWTSHVNCIYLFLFMTA